MFALFGVICALCIVFFSEPEFVNGLQIRPRRAVEYIIGFVIGNQSECAHLRTQKKHLFLLIEIEETKYSYTIYINQPSAVCAEGKLIAIEKLCV